MEGIMLHSKVMTEIARQETRERLDARHRAELRASAAEMIGRCDAWLATSTRRPSRIEYRTTTPAKPARCGYCGADPCRRGDDPCCLWSAGLVEWRTAQSGTAKLVDGEWCPIEHRPATIVSVSR